MSGFIALQRRNDIFFERLESLCRDHVVFFLDGIFNTKERSRNNYDYVFI